MPDNTNDEKYDYHCDMIAARIFSWIEKSGAKYIEIQSEEYNINFEKATLFLGEE